MLLSSGETGEIGALSKELLKQLIKVYNFEVEDWHTYFVSDENVFVHNSCKAFMTPQAMNKLYSEVLSGSDIHFATQEKALEFVQNKFSSFKQEVAGSRSKEGWHFDNHSINGGKQALDHINIYSKGLGFRAHITWGD